MSERKILNSWKEIAKYLDCGVRTAQRLEFAGLPVRRPSGRNRSAVIAFKRDIDEWLRTRGDAAAIRNSTDPAAPCTAEGRKRMREQMRALRTQMAECRERSEQLRARAVELRARKASNLPQLSD